MCDIDMNLKIITFATSNWIKAKERWSIIFSEIDKLKGNEITHNFYTEKDLGDDYFDVFGYYTKDYAYALWSWKPYLIQKELKQIKDGDFLMYLDGGCQIPIDNNLIKFIQYTKNAMKCLNENNIDIGLTIDRYTKNIAIARKEILQDMNLQNDKEFLFKYYHFQAGVWIIKKTQHSMDLINKWYMYIKKNYANKIRSDYMDKTNQSPYYIHNGSDQCVLQCLLYKTHEPVLLLKYIMEMNIIQRIRG